MAVNGVPHMRRRICPVWGAQYSRLITASLAATVVSGLAACSPAFNWRETPIASTGLVALFPCKPQTVFRSVDLGGQKVELHMASCDTDGVTVAIGHATVKDASALGAALQQWRDATLAGVRPSAPPQMTPFTLKQSLALPQALSVQATGSAPDGRSVHLQGAWFARGSEVFAAVMYANAALSAEVAEPFFSGLKFR